MVAYVKDFSPNPRVAVPQNRIGDYFCENDPSDTANRPSGHFPSQLGAHDYDPTASGMFFYGYRYYDPETGRWPNRDPIEEEGGLNLYGFVGNDGVNQWYYLGYFVWKRERSFREKKVEDVYERYYYICECTKTDRCWDCNWRLLWTSREERKVIRELTRETRIKEHYIPISEQIKEAIWGFLFPGKKGNNLSLPVPYAFPQESRTRIRHLGEELVFKDDNDPAPIDARSVRPCNKDNESLRVPVERYSNQRTTFGQWSDFEVFEIIMR